MNTRELNELISKMIAEALEAVARRGTPHAKKYRRSKMHPVELHQQSLVPQKDMFGIPKPLTQNRLDAAYVIPPEAKTFLIQTLLNMKAEPLAQATLMGVPLDKPNAMFLARKLMAIPQFPIQQPRKLMSLLILLSLENQK